MEAIEGQQYLTFLLAREIYAVSILRIREIIEHSQLTQVPMMPAFIRGVINLRGRVVPVLDLNARFGAAQTVINRRSCIVILETLSNEGQQDIGVMVDAVNEVLDIPTSEIEPPPGFGAGLRSRFIKGIGKVAGQFVILLDTDCMLSVDELDALAGLGVEEKAFT
jgi:purine-binding chemotaxis protein CheW